MKRLRPAAKRESHEAGFLAKQKSEELHFLCNSLYILCFYVFLYVCFLFYFVGQNAVWTCFCQTAGRRCSLRPAQALCARFEWVGRKQSIYTFRSNRVEETQDDTFSRFHRQTAGILIFVQSRADLDEWAVTSHFVFVFSSLFRLLATSLSPLPRIVAFRLPASPVILR